MDAASALPAALDARFSSHRRERHDDDRAHLRVAIGDGRRSLATPVDVARVRDTLLALVQTLTLRA